MQKNKKIVLLCITLFVSLFSFNNYVSASQTKETKESGVIIADNKTLEKATKINQTHTKYNFHHYGMNITKNGEVITSDQTSTYLYEHHYIPNVSKQQKNIYCLDAIKKGTSELYAVRFLIDEGNHASVNAYDAALMSVLTANATYTHKSIAIRAISFLWNYNKTEAGYNLSQDVKDLVEAYSGQVYKWIKEDQEIQNLYLKLYDKIDKTRDKDLPKVDVSKGEIYDFDGNAIVDNGYHFDYNKNVEGIIEDNTIRPARNLFAWALRDALDYLNSKEKASVKEGVTSSSVVNVEKQGEQDLVSGVITHNFVLKEFTNDGKASFMISNLLYKYAYKGVEDGVPVVDSITIKNGSNTTKFTKENYNGSFLNVNLLDSSKFNIPALDYSKEITISVGVKIAGYKAVEGVTPTKETLKCSNGTLEYQFDYTWQDSSLKAFNKFDNYVGIVWYGTLAGGEATDTDNQRFISVETNANASSSSPNSSSNSNRAKGSYTFDLGCDSCNTLISKCNGNDSEACSLLAERSDCGCEAYQTLCNKGDNAMCTKLKEEPACVPATCGTEVVGNFQCCDIDNNILLVETKNKEININGPQNVVNCFVNQVDSNRTSRTDGDIINDEAGNSYVMQNNRYCTVSCKEDYVLSMPSSKKVNASGYFTFDMSIKGTKSCYTNTIDKNETFMDDVRAAEAAVKEASDVYNAVILIRNAAKSSEFSKTSETHTGSTDYSYSCTKTSIVTGTDCSDRSDCYRKCKNSPNQTECGDACDEIKCKPTTTTETYTGTCDDGTCSNTPTSGTGYSFTAYGGTYYYGVKSISGPNNHGSSSTSSSCTWSKNYYTRSALSYGNTFNKKSYNRTSSYTLTSASSYDDIVSDALKVLIKANDRLEHIIEEYEQCSTFTNKYEYKPVINYSYYVDKGKTIKGDMGLVDSNYNKKDGENAEEWYCTTSLTNGYGPGNCRGINNESTSMPKRTIRVFKCSITSNDPTCINQDVEIPSAKYVSKISTVNASYKPENKRYNYLPSGIVKDDYDKLSSIPAGKRLSVDLNSGKEIKQYDISISNLGEFYDSDSDSKKLGRLIGDDNAALKENELLNINNNNQATYHCSYLVNMGNIKEGDLECVFDGCSEPCEFDCVGSGCEDYCPGGNCDFDCLGSGCIYSKEDGLYVYEKEISLNNLFPVGTDSYNWSSSNQKAKDTVAEIQEKAENVYAEDPILKVTIDGSAAAKIKVYNKEHPSYSDGPMYFRDIGDYEKIAGYSQFIDELIKGTYGVDIDSNSEVLKKRNTNNPTQNNYFSIWGKYRGQSMLGPSWK